MGLSPERFLSNLVRSGLYSRDEVQRLLEEVGVEPSLQDAQELAKRLVAAEKLTAFQAKLLCQGKARSLVLGEYEVLAPLGRGGMGQVYKARHRRLGRVVALKVLSASAYRDEEAKARFEKEMRAAGRLVHPNVALALDAGEAFGVPYLVTEYVEGIDLERLVEERGPLPWPEAVRCVLQAAEGLAYAHQQGVVHRDVKPSNLILSRDGVVKILDLGLARLLSEEGPTTQRLTRAAVIGTWAYMSPEQALDTSRADHRSDIYSLGCTLYWLIAGRSPYESSSETQILLAHQQAPIPSLLEVDEDVPVWLQGLFERMLAKNPLDRPQSMREVISELQAVLEASGRSGDAGSSAAGVTNWAQDAGGLSTDSSLSLVGAEASQTDEEAKRLRRSRGGVRNTEADFQTRKQPAAYEGTWWSKGRLRDSGWFGTLRRWSQRPVVWACAAGVLVGFALVLLVLLGLSNRRQHRPRARSVASVQNELVRGRDQRAANPAANAASSPRLERTGSGGNQARLNPQTKQTDGGGTGPSANKAGPSADKSVATKEASEPKPAAPNSLASSAGPPEKHAKTEKKQNPPGTERKPSPSLPWRFRPPVNLGPPVNTPADEYGPDISADGQLLFFSSKRNGSHGRDIWMARRRKDLVWEAPVRLGPPVSTPSFESGPELSRDGMTLIVVSKRPLTGGGKATPYCVLWECRRSSPQEPFKTAAKLPVPSEPLSKWGPCLSADQLELYFGSFVRLRGRLATRIWVCKRRSAFEPFEKATLVTTLTSRFAGGHPELSSDGLVLFFSSPRPGGLGGLDIYMSVRASRDSPWGPPVNVGPPVNSRANEDAPCISADGRFLFFSSDRKAGGLGGQDLWVAERIFEE